MTQKDPFFKYPHQVPASTARPGLLYDRLPGYYAVHGRPPHTPAEGAAYLFNEGAIAVFQGEPQERKDLSSSNTVSPVYALQPQGPPAVATGLVLVRFRESVSVETRRKDLDRAGYLIAQVLDYAPHAAWVRARSGEIVEALTGLSVLAKLPDVENVEPQMLIKSGRRL
ncbi:MAG: hypothetical protein ACREJU_03105 [Nitrospiraceae bacterium]